MYEELKDHLRECAKEIACGGCGYGPCFGPEPLMLEAIEAIEKLEIQVNNYKKALDALERSTHEKLP